MFATTRRRCGSGHDFEEARDHFALIIEQASAEVVGIPDALRIVRRGGVSAGVDFDAIAGRLPEIDGLSARNRMARRADVLFQTIDGDQVGNLADMVPILKEEANVMDFAGFWVFHEREIVRLVVAGDPSSLGDTTAFDVPCKEIIEHLQIEQKQNDGYSYNKDGILVAFDCESLNLGSGLLIRKEFLEAFLRERSLRLFWTCIGEK